MDAHEETRVDSWGLGRAQEIGGATSIRKEAKILKPFDSSDLNCELLCLYRTPKVLPSRLSLARSMRRSRIDIDFRASFFYITLAIAEFDRVYLGFLLKIQHSVCSYSAVAQWWSIRLLTGGLQVRVLPAEPLCICCKFDPPEADDVLNAVRKISFH